MTKIKKTIIAIALGFSAFISIQAYEDDFFEISKNLDIFASLYRELNIYYVDGVQPGEMMKTGIDAMLKSLDPYTNFIPESQIEEYKFMTTGQYGGIGALIRKKGDYIILTEIYEGFPAQKNGLRAGDKLIEIDGNSVVGKNSDQISAFLKGEPNSTVKILFERGEGANAKQMTRSIQREEIKIKDVPYYGMIDNHTGYINLSSFTPTASKEFIAAFQDLKANPEMKQLVFDLRGNGGGLLKESVDIVNVFVNKGTEVVYTKGKITEWNQSYKALNKPLDTEIPFAVLINGNSASASEIVAGSLQDLDRAVIVGSRSYGKGLVQMTRPLSYNAQLKVTVAKYYIPSGRCIQKIDYSHRTSGGKANSVPDSLIKSFKSLKYGRSLFDGKGIKPDIEVEPRTLSPITQTLILKSYVFDFATSYHASHESIAEPTEFHLTEADYQDFVNYLSDKDYSYETETENLLSELKSAAEEERYFEPAKEEFEKLRSKLVVDKADDLEKFKDEIMELLEYEIISRYYYNTGQIEATLSQDPVVIEARKILASKDAYQQILQGKDSSDTK